MGVMSVLYVEPVSKVLHKESEATGNGELMNLGGKFGAVTVQVIIETTAVVTFEGTQDGVNFVAMRGINKNNGEGVTSASASGIFTFAVTGIKQFRARISSYAAGKVDVMAIAVPTSEPSLTSNEFKLTGSSVTVSATQTRPDNATPYTALDVVGTNPATNMTFATGLTAGAGFVVYGARLRIDVAAIPAGMASFRLHLFNAAPTAIADNVAFNLIAADRAKYLGYVEISGVLDVGDTLFAEVDNINFTGKLATASLFGVLQTVGAYTPTAQAVKTVTLIMSEL